MGFSSDEFLRMREMESYTFDYFVPLRSERHYSFDIEAESEEEAVKEAENYINGNWLGSDDIVSEWDYPDEVETGSTLYLGNKVVKSY
jgi:hypothetical protein